MPLLSRRQGLNKHRSALSWPVCRTEHYVICRPSLPSRGRGSKPSSGVWLALFTTVAPFTGAWIETFVVSFLLRNSAGRSLHGGVDRNANLCAPELIHPRSLPSRGRGSKRVALGRRQIAGGSLPSRGRGSKRRSAARGRAVWGGRSLHGGVDRNPAPQSSKSSFPVAPFTGAWIETPSPTISCRSCLVAPFTGAWIETSPILPAKANT
jgi:hypothetical protein